MSDAELRVAAKAIDGFIARVEKLEAENAELKADSEACREVILELEAEVERLKGENETLRNRIARLDIYESAVRRESDG